MIDIIFTYFSDSILVRIKGNEITFGNTAFGSKLANIEGIRLSQKGVLKEFPDLKDNNNWRAEAIKRFKKKIKSMQNEEQIYDYIIEDLSKYGYVPKIRQLAGHRPESIKWHG